LAELCINSSFFFFFLSGEKRKKDEQKFSQKEQVYGDKLKTNIRLFHFNLLHSVHLFKEYRNKKINALYILHCSALIRWIIVAARLLNVYFTINFTEKLQETKKSLIFFSQNSKNFFRIFYQFFNTAFILYFYLLNAQQMRMN